MTAITVTADHISEGIPADCGECPIALAISEAFPLTEVVVYKVYANIWARRGFERIGLPREAREFIEHFDNGSRVAPFTFELDYPAVTS